MTEGPAPGGLRYREPAPDGRPPMALAVAPGGEEAPRFPFSDRLEIGRDEAGRPEEPGLLLVADDTVSRRHCVVSRRPDGRCFVRDMSRNGTRLDGRRLMPNVETELPVGALLAVAAGRAFVLEGEGPAAAAAPDLGLSTVPRADRSVATVLVGDIRDYTVLVRTALTEALQRSVGRVFESLSAAVVDQGGAVKEFQGDAILAYWEGDLRGLQAVRACRAALALDALVGRLATDRSVWAPEEVPLRMDWALCTGLVLIDSIGHHGPVGLSMMGEPVVRAFRIEKFAGDETGRIVTCPATHELAGGAFRFRDLGERQAKGFDAPDRLYALLGEA